MNLKSFYKTQTDSGVRNLQLTLNVYTLWRADFKLIRNETQQIEHSMAVFFPLHHVESLLVRLVRCTMCNACYCLWSVLTTVIPIWAPLRRKEWHVWKCLFYICFVLVDWSLSCYPPLKMTFLAKSTSVGQKNCRQPAVNRRCVRLTLVRSAVFYFSRPIE